MKTVCLVSSLLLFYNTFSQPLRVQLEKAVAQLEKDSQFAHAIISINVVDGKTGKPVYEKNTQIGLAPASCQKVITSAAAFELLGNDFRYKTYIGKDYSASGAGSLFIIGDGDPTLGSWRWKSTADTAIFSKILASLRRQQLTSFSENLIIDDYKYGLFPLPDGWVCRILETTMAQVVLDSTGTRTSLILLCNRAINPATLQPSAS